MRTLGNILWFVLAGVWLAIAYLLAGVLACILIITIPLGLQAFKLAAYVIWPFGRTVIPKVDRSAAGSAIGNVIWFVIAGWWLALSHLITAVLLAITIIGIPLAIANLKMVPLAFAPFGKEIVKASSVTTTDALSIPQLG